jgi:PKD domain
VGTYTVTATVTDGQSRTSSDSRQVTVRLLTGSWFEAEYVQNSKRVEIRRLTVTAQDGLTIRGRYQVTSAADRAFTGTLTAPRNARIVMDDGATLEGVIPERLGDAGANWMLQARGDTVDGERLEFRPVTGDANSPPPDAVMKVQFGEDDGVEPIMGLTPVEIDGTASRGTGLSYFIEFGDGNASSSAKAAHVVSVPGLFVARLSVVDSMGHSDSESMPYYPYQLSSLGDSWTSSDSFSSADLWVRFDTDTGAICAGVVKIEGRIYAATAKLSGERSIQIAVATAGVEFRGEVRLGSGTFPGSMRLVQTVGRDDGRTWALHRHEEY